MALHLAGHEDFPLPQVYIEYILCTKFYHCLPSELAEEDWRIVNQHLACYMGEHKVGKH